MTLEQQVCSLELSKRLRELGVRQESLFWWYELYGEDRWTLAPLSKSGNHTLAAYTVAELVEPMKDWMNGNDENNDTPPDCPLPNCMTELYDPNFLARLLIYLIENGLLAANK